MNNGVFRDKKDVEDDGQSENNGGSEVGFQQPNKLKRPRVFRDKRDFENAGQSKNDGGSEVRFQQPNKLKRPR